MNINKVNNVDLITGRKKSMNQYIAFDLDTLFEKDFFSNLDYYFANSMAMAFNESDQIVLASCALVSKSLFEGHICIDINEMAGSVRVLETSDDRIKFPDETIWIKALQASSMVSGMIQTPLVLDSDNRLYFSKYYDIQNRLAKNIIKRAFSSPADLNEADIDEMLDSFFIQDNKHNIPQKNAVKNTVFNQFTIISGGPGTGKTYVTTIIKKVLRLCAEKKHLPEPRILSVAPTGKAASKMDQGHTIHSILKPLKDRPGFYYNKKNQLQIDAIIIDEASMIDISLLTRLLEAVPLAARVILLGDKHQLSSIQAGMVFSDICNVKELCSNIFILEYNFRSKGKTGIEKLSKAINNNDAQLLETLLTSNRYPDILFENTGDKNPGSGLLRKFVQEYIKEGYKSFIEADTLDASLDVLDDFKILCAHNSGTYGTLQVNHVCENILRSRDNFDIQKNPFKKIIMVKTNDYKKGLFNGDTGIVYEKKSENNAFFKGRGSVRQFRSSDLPGYDAAFAITIHKSQGSEFNTVLMIIPDKLSRVITRQLLYTGVTRAKTRVIIVGNIEIIKKAINLSVKRNSGLSMCLEKKICNNKK